MDGRRLRAQRTREAVLDALFALLEEGVVQPSVEEIAVRAGVSERSVFGHFHDRETLFAAVGARQRDRLDAEWGELPSPQAPLEERLDAFVAQRARVYELVTPVRRAGLLMEPFSREASLRIATLRDLKRRETWRLFEPELRGDPARAAAVAALASWSGWDALRTQQGLSAADASAALRAGLAALLRG